MKFCNVVLSLLILVFASDGRAEQQVDNAQDLVIASHNAEPGAIIQLAPGVYELSAPLVMTTRVTLRGSGMDETTITHVDHWKPSLEALPLGEMRPDEANKEA